MNSFIGLTSSYLHARNYLWELVQSFCQYSLAFEERLKVPRFYGCVKISSTVVFLNLLRKYYVCYSSRIYSFSPFSKKKGKKPTECPKTC